MACSHVSLLPRYVLCLHTSSLALARFYLMSLVNVHMTKIEPIWDYNVLCNLESNQYSTITVPV